MRALREVSLHAQISLVEAATRANVAAVNREIRCREAAAAKATPEIS